MRPCRPALPAAKSLTKTPEELLTQAKTPGGCADRTGHMQIPAGDSRQGSAEKLTDGEWITRWPIKDLLGNSKPRRKSMQDYFVGKELLISAYPTTAAHADQDLPFDASFAADMTPPVICRICSPALVN